MTTRYDQPTPAARAFNEVFRLLAEGGISVAGTVAIRVRGRKTGKRRGVVVNLLTVDGRDYVVSPRGNTQWVRNARAAGGIEMGPRWRSREVRIAEVADDAKPELLIFADDVQCAHGNTVGALDEDAVFYAMQRGIPAEQARALLTAAFVGEVIDRIEHEGAREIALAWAERQLGAL